MKRKTGLLAILAAMTLVSACGGAAETGKQGKEPQAGKPDAPVKLGMLVSAQGNWTYSKDKPIWKEIQKRTNVEIDGQVPPGDKYEEALNLTIASGNMPDLLFVPTIPTANKYGQQGAFVNILDYADKMPNLKKFLQEYPQIKERYLSSSGKMHLFPNEGFGETNRIIWMYRDDIFKKHGLKLPETYEELYGVLKQLKQLYPNSYPFATRGAFGTLSRMAVNYGTFNNVYYDFDKKEWRYGPIEDRYKDMVAFMSRLQKEGLIAPDWLTFNTKKWEDAIATDKAFLFLDYIVMDYYNVPLRKNNPEFTMLFMPPPAGTPGGKRQNINQNVVDAGLSVASTSKKIDEAMRYMDYFYSAEGKELSTWGIEGVTYEVANGKKKYLDQFKTLSDLREKPGLLNYGTYTRIDHDAIISFNGQESKDAYADARKYDAPLQPNPAFNEKETDIMSTIGQSIAKHREENVTKFILGERSLSEWDQYVNEVKKLGLDQLVKSYKDAYDRIASK